MFGQAGERFAAIDQLSTGKNGVPFAHDDEAPQKSMKYLLVPYMILFGLAVILMFCAEFFVGKKSERDSIWQNVIDLITSVILFCGMLFLALDLPNPLLKQIWMFLSPAAVIIQLIASWRARSRAAKNPNSNLSKVDRSVADIGALLLAFPSLVFNLVFVLR